MAEEAQRTVIDVRDLRVRFGAVTALDGLDLRIGAGSIGLLGPNGAGKSTLIKVLLGLVRPREGEAHLLGVPVRGRQAREVRARVGYMAEEESLVPRLDAVAFLVLCARLSGIPAEAALKRAHEALYLVGLGEARYRPCETYSTGMRQRLKLAQALVHGPELLILDEPTSGLDPAGRREMLDLIRDVSQREGMDVLLSTHLLGDVEEVCERAAVIDRGRLILQGPIEDLRRGIPDRYEVRVKGDAAAFRSEAEKRGARFSEVRGQQAVVDLPTGTSTRELLEAGDASGCQVRLLRPAVVSLREAFSAALEGQGS